MPTDEVGSIIRLYALDQNTYHFGGFALRVLVMSERELIGNTSCPRTRDGLVADLRGLGARGMNLATVRTVVEIGRIAVDMNISTVDGACHCGAVRFRVRLANGLHTAR